MRLFVSYARVDKHYCEQVIDMLDMHEVWYDQRLQVGQRWWNEIMNQLQWCDGFIYLLSPESIASHYCQKEAEIARRLEKVIFPIVIQENTMIPQNLSEYQFADLSRGLDGRAVKMVLSALYMAERDLDEKPVKSLDQLPASSLNMEDTASIITQTESFIEIINKIGKAMDEHHYDMAVFLIKQLIKDNVDPHFIDLQALLQEAEDELEKQAYLRQANREYQAIKALLQHESTRPIGINSYRMFQKNYLYYDPDNLKETYLAPLNVTREYIIDDWCFIPDGKVVLSNNRKRIEREVEAFDITKYPITNEQYQWFIDDPDGYRSKHWWKFSKEAFHWHSLHPEPLSPYGGALHPRTNICWYEVVAYCRWLSHYMSFKIRLPTSTEWQYAAQGNDAYQYPWGNTFDKDSCNTKENRYKKLMPVDTFAGGESPFGVWDMAGNAWEWTHTRVNDEECPYQIIVKGGSYLSPSTRATNTFRYRFRPEYRYMSIGFRVVREVTTAC